MLNRVLDSGSDTLRARGLRSFTSFFQIVDDFQYYQQYDCSQVDLFRLMRNTDVSLVEPSYRTYLLKDMLTIYLNNHTEDSTTNIEWLYDCFCGRQFD